MPKDYEDDNDAGQGFSGGGLCATPIQTNFIFISNNVSFNDFSNNFHLTYSNKLIDFWSLSKVIKPIFVNCTNNLNFCNNKLNYLNFCNNKLNYLVNDNKLNYLIYLPANL